jgi:hypothetical protein
MRRVFWIVLSLAMSASATGSAQGTEEQRAACKSDAFRLCDDYVPDAAAVEQCLRANMRRLSPACRREFGGGKRRR